jgi:glycosyltransferase involved in cell wall biosynthesis
MNDGSSLIVQLGILAGRTGGVDRYFDGLLSRFESSDPLVRGFLFGHHLPVLVPSNVQIVGMQNENLQGRFRRMKQAVQQFEAQYPTHPVLVASHFALYSLPFTNILNRRKAMKLVSHFHGPWADESAAEKEPWIGVALKRLIERWVYSRSDKVVSDSQAFADLARTRYHVPKSKVVAVPAGTDTEPFVQASKSTIADARHRLGWPQGRKIVVTVRRLSRRMGLDHLIHAVSSIAKIHPDLLVMIAGKGSMRDELQSQIDRLGLQSIVQMVGFISDEDLPYAYRAADLSIVPSTSLEGFGLVAVESLASGTPVMVTPVGGMPEIVLPLCKELVLTGFDVDSIAAGLDGFLRGRILTPSSTECVRYVEANYTWDRVLPKLLDVYRNV